MVPRIAIAGVAAVLAGAAGAGTRASPPFTVTVSRATAVQLRFSYHAGCPVAPAALRNVRIAYWGFDGRRRLGTLVVNRSVVGEVVAVFRRLYRVRFPIRRIRPVEAYRGSDDRSMAADNTSAFNCRRAVASGPPQWSAHAYGAAIDVNPLENPYVLNGKVLPPRGARYADRATSAPAWPSPAASSCRPSPPPAGSGAAAGRLPDYQHFSRPAASQATRCH